MKGLQKLIRQLGSLQTGWLAAQNWPKIEFEAQVLSAYLHTFDKKNHTLNIEEDYQPGKNKLVAIDPRKTPQQKIKELYGAVKKHKLSLPRLEKAIYAKKEEIANFKEEEILHPAALLKEKRLPYLSFTSASGIKILVGKNASGNDFLTFKIAKGNDLWMHASHEKGAHVVVCLDKGKVCDQDTLDHALKLAVKHSKAEKKGEAEVVVSLKKWVKKPKGKSVGMALVSHPKFYYVKL